MADYPPIYALTTPPAGGGAEERSARLIERTYTPTPAAQVIHDPAFAPIIRADRAAQAIAAGDPYLTDVKAAADRWAALRDSAYRAYWRSTGVPVSPARFHDVTQELADLYADPTANQSEIAAALAALGLS